jgi:hypothetical protein
MVGEYLLKGKTDSLVIYHVLAVNEDDQWVNALEWISHATLYYFLVQQYSPLQYTSKTTSPFTSVQKKRTYCERLQ